MRKLRLITIIMVAIFTYGCAGDVEEQGPGQSKDVVPGQIQTSDNTYPLHKDVSVTLFWIGEGGTAANSYIPNIKSAWDDKWEEHYGGVDDPYNRNGYLPANFVPNENPFYFALPYNDFNGSGSRKNSVIDTIYWSGEKQWGALESMCKNRWIQIIKGDRVAYAQWEDVGPYNEDDSLYVFGNSSPQNTINSYAGLDISPAVRDYLGLSNSDIVDWKFIAPDKVPNGPWTNIVTDSQITWN